MPDWLEIVLIVGALVVASLVLHAAVYGRKGQEKDRRRLDASEALATGGVSLFARRRGAEPQLARAPRSLIVVILDALATGGVSVFTEPNARTPRPEARGRPGIGS